MPEHQWIVAAMAPDEARQVARAMRSLTRSADAAAAFDQLDVAKLARALELAHPVKATGMAKSTLDRSGMTRVRRYWSEQLE